MTPFEHRVLPVGELKPAAYNPRRVLKPTDPAYRKLKASLAAFGLVEPLVWNELTGRVVGGHARLRILRDLGVAEVPVSVVRLTEERERALNVVLNNQEAQSRYDPSKLADLLEGLADTLEMGLTGFDGKTLAALRFEPAGVTADEPANDQVEVTLVADAATFDAAWPRLDALVREFDLVTHVRR